MNALVINPPWETDKGYGARSNCRWPHVETTRFTHFPIYLGYTVAMLREAEVETEVIDCAVGDLDSTAFSEVLRQKKADICFIETATPTIDQDLKNARLCKEILGAKVVLMGAHVAVLDEQCLQDAPWVDGIIRGEFEQAAVDLCIGEWSEVPGITWRDSEEIRRTPNRTEHLELDQMPLPAWDAFDLDFYDWALLPAPAMLMIATRGCPFQCSYCLWPQTMYGHKQRRRSPESICDEIEALQKKYGIKGIRFDDDTFALNAKYVRDVCEEILRRGLEKTIQFSCFGHTAAPDEELYRLMRKAGFIQLDFGIETGSGDVLSGIGKGTYIDNAIGTVELCRKLGIQTYGTYMMGFPDETEEDILATLKLALKLDTDFMQVSYVLPYPGTKLYDECKEQGILPYGEDWTRYDGMQPVIINKVPRERLMKLYKTFWSRYFLRPRFVGYFFQKAFQSPKDFLKAISGALYILRKVVTRS